MFRNFFDYNSLKCIFGLDLGNPFCHLNYRGQNIFMDQLKSLLTSLLNPGEQIKELEKTYQDEFVAKNPEMLLSYLATILCDESSGSDPIRALAGVLFRRSAFTSSNLWNSSSVDLKNHVKQTLLKSFMMATYKKNIYNKLCDLMAEVIRAELTYSGIIKYLVYLKD